MATVPATAAAQQDPFSDVTAGVHKPAIDALNELGLFEGTLCGEDIFCPRDPIKRSTMAVWLIRALQDDEPPAVDMSRFSDVADDEWWAPHVERLAELEITVGCRQQPLRYCPDRPVNRGQVASFLVRAYDVETAEPAGFTDIEGSSHAANIDALAAAGITVGCEQDPLRFCPSEAVTRAQMATLLFRALEAASTPAGSGGTGPVPRSGSGGTGPVPRSGASFPPAGALPNPGGNSNGGQTGTPATTFTAVTTGVAHVCGLRNDRTVACWGYDGWGQASPPGGTFTAITAGAYHNCGLRVDRTVTCWGYDRTGTADAPSGTFTAIDADAYFTCGLRDDSTITCWGGANSWGETDAPSGTFTAVTAGWRHGCGLRIDHTVTCWGENRNGQLNAPSGTFTAISAGSYHTCGLRDDNTVTCWSSNSHGQMNAPGGTFTAISAGAYHTCGLRDDNTVTCWGHNGNGQADAPSGRFTAVATQDHHSCGVRAGADGAIICWGSLRLNTAQQAS